jgi:hypothetical protein
LFCAISTLITPCMGDRVADAPGESIKNRMLPVCKDANVGSGHTGRSAALKTSGDFGGLVFSQRSSVPEWPVTLSNAPGIYGPPQLTWHRRPQTAGGATSSLPESGVAREGDGLGTVGGAELEQD